MVLILFRISVGGFSLVWESYCCLSYAGNGMPQIKKEKIITTGSILAVLFISVLFSSCSASPSPLNLGKDNCQFCEMTISDIRFGAEIITRKGKIFKFDDPQCAISFLKAHPDINRTLQEIYFTDFSDPHSLIPSRTAFFLKSENLQAPMGGTYTAFSSMENLNKVKQEFPGSVLNWNEMNKP